jgi:predicted DCC family thiol-disulfide oxidoreductase YuxK
MSAAEASLESSLCTVQRSLASLRACYSSFNMVAATAGPEMLFYDGHCGLCHGAVQFVLRHDGSGKAFRFAPLQGTMFEQLVPATQRSQLPDSIVVLTRQSSLLVKSDAIIYILRQLGGFWRILAGILRVFPRFLRDAGYDFIAGVRYRIFGRRDDVCPVMPPELRARFNP